MAPGGVEPPHADSKVVQEAARNRKYLQPTTFDAATKRSELQESGDEPVRAALRAPRFQVDEKDGAPYVHGSCRGSDGLEPSTPSLPSSNEAGTAGEAGKPRAREVP
jgi:hypothetical protein